mmetsp:Transcript_19167/g.34999  ORF Transcript_19167/g.34999 Transcript_19167/m.34999 type:complete len:378 (+) Transcript_19167:138-1271(+)
MSDTIRKKIIRRNKPTHPRTPAPEIIPQRVEEEGKQESYTQSSEIPSPVISVQEESMPPIRSSDLNEASPTFFKSESLSSVPAKSFIPTFDGISKLDNVCQYLPTTALPRVKLSKAADLLSKGNPYIKYLLAEYGLWRRVYPDGSCYYRCVGIQYIEHLCSPAVENSEFEDFLNNLRTEKGYFSACKDSLLCKPFMVELNDLFKLKVQSMPPGNSSVAVFRQLENLILGVDFDTYLVFLMRRLAANFLKTNYQDERVRPYYEGTADDLFLEIDTNGNEAVGLAKAALPNVLRFVIGIESNSEGTFLHESYKPWAAGNFYEMTLWYRPQHNFDAIYSRKRAYADGYDLKSQAFKDTSFNDRMREHIRTKKLMITSMPD